jgi:hypothetical protein
MYTRTESGWKRVPPRLVGSRIEFFHKSGEHGPIQNKPWKKELNLKSDRCLNLNQDKGKSQLVPETLFLQ